MSKKSTNPRKVVLEWRYKPELTFYRKMDEIGDSLAADFPTWKRQSLNLEIQNREQRQRLFLSHHRTFLECDPIDVEAPAILDFAASVGDRVNQQLGIDRCQRLGLRQWFALTFDQSLGKMVEQLGKRFFVQNAKVSNLLGGKIDDLQYIVDLELEDRWHCHLRVGPMVAAQWLDVLPYRDQLAPDGVLTQESLKEIRASLPDPLLYVDLDYFLEDIPISEFSSTAKNAQQRAAAMVRELINYFRKG